MPATLQLADRWASQASPLPSCHRPFLTVSFGSGLLRNVRAVPPTRGQQACGRCSCLIQAGPHTLPAPAPLAEDGKTTQTDRQLALARAGLAHTWACRTAIHRPEPGGGAAGRALGGCGGRSGEALVSRCLSRSWRLGLDLFLPWSSPLRLSIVWTRQFYLHTNFSCMKNVSQPHREQVESTFTPVSFHCRFTACVRACAHSCPHTHVHVHTCTHTGYLWQGCG